MEKVDEERAGSQERSGQTEILVRFYDVQDYGGNRIRNVGWICHPAGVADVDGAPIGHGVTMCEAFLSMLRRIEEPESERVMRTFGRVISR